MLAKRAQILFDRQTYKILEEIAHEKKSSVGKLIRKAVMKTYTKTSKTKKPSSLAKAAKDTFGAWRDDSEVGKKKREILAGVWARPDEVFDRS